MIDLVDDGTTDDDGDDDNDDDVGRGVRGANGSSHDDSDVEVEATGYKPARRARWDKGSNKKSSADRAGKLMELESDAILDGEATGDEESKRTGLCSNEGGGDDGSNRSDDNLCDSDDSSVKLVSTSARKRLRKTSQISSSSSQDLPTRSKPRLDTGSGGAADVGAGVGANADANEVLSDRMDGELDYDLFSDNPLPHQPLPQSASSRFISSSARNNSPPPVDSQGLPLGTLFENDYFAIKARDANKKKKKHDKRKSSSDDRRRQSAFDIMREAAADPSRAAGGGRGSSGGTTSSSTAKYKGLGKKIIVFFHHTQVLDALERALQELRVGYVRIDGAVTGKKRYALIEQFQTDDVVS